MKSLVALFESLLRDSCSLYDIDPTRDLNTVRARYREEGEPFLTITLDAFRVGFEAALENGSWDVIVPGFRKDGQLPAFLRGFVSRVFQRDGRIRPNPDVTAIRIIRQLTGFAAKMRVECNPKYTTRALEDYLEVDARATSGSSAELTAVFADLFDSVLLDVRDEMDSFSLSVRHGNGASQEKLLPNSRWQFSRWEERMEPFFPSWLYCRYNDRHAIDVGIEYIQPSDHPVRVAFVPKTAKGPRTIAVEPSWRMYAQQGLMSALVRSIEKRGLPPRFTTSDDNRRAAREGSENRRIATIDLSSASDSVSARLVAELFSGRPDVRDALFACRSTQAELPDGTVHTLNKFASMGSAVCFPVEAMVFAAIAVHAMAPRTSDGRISFPIDREVIDNVIVFGDDIIVPSDMYSVVVANLEAYGFKVNTKKSFVKGYFRESCGADYYMGHNVAYVKVRHPLSSSTATAVETASTVSLRNQLAATGLYPETVRKLDRFLVRGLGAFPYGSATSPGLVRVGGPHSEDIPPYVARMRSSLNRGEHRAYVVTPQFASDVPDGRSALHRALRLLNGRLELEPRAPSFPFQYEETPVSEPVSYETAGRAVRVRLNARWLPA